MYYCSAEMFSRIDRDLLKDRERSGDLWRAQEAARYLKTAKAERPSLQSRALLSIGCFLVSVGLKLNGQENLTCQPSYQCID